MISVGHTAMARDAGITINDLRFDGCKMVVKGNIVYLIGRDSASPEHTRAFPTTSGPQGTVRAVAMFLEDIVGVRWFAPGPRGTVVPSKKNISVNDSDAGTFIPAIAYCRGKSPCPNPIALYANNYRVAMRYKAFGGHSWEVFVDDKEYFDEHPEYFALLANGERSRSEYSKETGLLIRNSHLCTSNMDVRQIIVDKIRALFDEGYDMVQLGQSDSWQPCLCAECMKMDDHRTGKTTRENPCEKIWVMHHWILQELYKSHPNKFVNVLVYGPTAWPSKKIASLPPNAVMEMAPITENRLDAWHGKIKNLTTYTYWFEDNCRKSSFVPAVSPDWFQKTLRRYRDLGVIGIRGTPRMNWGLGGPSYYAYGKLLGNPDADIDRMLHEYCMGIYREAGPTMKRFFKLLHRRSGKTMDTPYFRSAYHAEEVFPSLYQPKIIHEMDRLLTIAETRATSEQAKGWVKHTRDCFDGLKTVAEMFFAKWAFDGNPCQETLLEVKARVDAVEKWRERILSYGKAYTDEWFPEYHAMASFVMTGGRNSMYDEYYYGIALREKHQEEFLAGKRKIRGIGMGGDLIHHDISEPITWDFEAVERALAARDSTNRETIDLSASQLVNGSFEMIEGDGTANDWALNSYPVPDAMELLGRCGITTETAHSGNRSIKLDFSSLTSNEIKEANAVAIVQNLSAADIRPLLGKKGLFSMWVCYDSMSLYYDSLGRPAGPFPGPGLDFVVQQNGETETSLQGEHPIILNRPYFARDGYVSDAQIIGEWIKVEEEIEVPEHAESLSIRIGMRVWRPFREKPEINTSAVFIDDISLTPIGG